MTQRITRSPYLTDSRVQTFYFLQRMGITGEIFSLEDLSQIHNGYQISSIVRCLPRWKQLMLKQYLLEDGRTFFNDRRPDRQFYICRRLSLWDDWIPFMQSCFWDRSPILPPQPEEPASSPDPVPVSTPPLPDDFYWLMGVLFTVFALLYGSIFLQAIKKQWTWITISI